MRTIAVVTGSRAEYGLLRWLLEDIQRDDALRLQLIATGMHLSTEFGLTYRSIEAEGFHIDEKVHILVSSDDPVAIAKSVGLGTIGFADALARLRPDVVLLLGDRFELLAAAQAALLLRIPIAHLHGGEASVGAIDESIRHALTKMSSLHFVAAEAYRRRVIQMGEDPSRVFLVGTSGLDVLGRVTLATREAIEQDVGLSLRSPSFLVTYHPATLGDRPAVEALKELLTALDRFPAAHVLVTRANADSEGRAINAALDAWAAGQPPDRVAVHTSLGQLRYLAAMRCVNAVVGNSSSGLIEAPAMRIPTVNIGPRQDGRLKADSVIDCAERADAIEAALKSALTPEHAARVRRMHPPYGDGPGASSRIKEVLKTVPLEHLTRKVFYDVSFEEVSRGA